MARLLVVDDAPDVLLALSAALAAAGHEAMLAADEATALDLVRKQHFDLVVANTAMPGLDGWSVLAELERTEGSPPVRAMAHRSYERLDIDALCERVLSYLSALPGTAGTR